MRVSRRFRIEELEARDVPAMILPVLFPDAVVVSTPDHTHALVAQPVVFSVQMQDHRLDSAAAQQPAAEVGTAARIGPIIDTAQARIGPIIDTAFTSMTPPRPGLLLPD